MVNSLEIHGNLHPIRAKVWYPGDSRFDEFRSKVTIFKFKMFDPIRWTPELNL